MKTLLPSLTAVTVLLLAGCGTSADEPAAKPEAKETSAPATSLIPKPTETQAADLVETLNDIAPGLADEPEDTVDNARNTCTSILSGANNLVEATKTRFVGDGVETLTNAQAKAIVKAVKAEVWCK